MSIIYRAYLYLVRNKGKSVTLFFMMTVICTLVLLCISVGFAASSSLLGLREKMGGYFKMERNIRQGHFEYLNDDMIQEIMENGEIKAYNGMDTRFLLAEDLELVPGRFTLEKDQKARLARVLGNTDSSLNEYFLLEYYRLKEGRHISSDDDGKALISEELAQRNHLSVGDTFTMKLEDEWLADEQKQRIKAHKLEIVGIYQIHNAMSSGLSDTAECDKEENFIFTDTAYLRKIYEELTGGKINSYTEGALFFLKDPSKLNEVIIQLYASYAYVQNDFIITKNNQTYENFAGPLERISGLITYIIAAIFMISVCMLSLILFLWMRDRVHEIGIYLSIGMKKWEIFGQHILECMLIAVVSFAISTGIAMAASQTVKQAVSDSFFEGTEEMEEAADMIDIQLNAAELGIVAGIGSLIILISSGVSSVLILRMQPKSVLSMMS